MINIEKAHFLYEKVTKIQDFFCWFLYYALFKKGEKPT